MASCRNNNNDKIIRDLVKRGADVNAVCMEGMTPLHYISKTNNYFMIKLLIEHGADVNRVSNNGNTALTYACMHKCDELITLLIEKGANIYHKNAAGLNSFQIVYDSDCVIIMKILISAGFRYEEYMGNNFKSFDINEYLEGFEHKERKNNFGQVRAANIFSHIVLVSDGYMLVK